MLKKQPDNLSVARDEIDAIDHEIVALLAKRQRVVKKVVTYKKENNMPVYHPAREEDLISKRRNQGASEGLDPNYVEELFRSMIRQSRVKQTGHLATRGVKPGANILIVGGMGGMGHYFRTWFLEAGYNVRILDKDDWSSVDALCKGIDLALICVPIDLTVSVIQQIGPYLPESCILSDVTSVKESTVKAMLASFQGPVLGLHPLFGPTTSTMDKQIVVATPGRDLESCTWLLDQFATWGNIMVQASPEEHDEIMGFVQALRHFATFGFGQFLYKKNVPVSRTLEFSSPIYRLELAMVGRLFAQDSSLYSSIIFDSKKKRALIKEYLKSMYENMEMLEECDTDAFNQEFKKISDWFGEFSEQALRESSFLIDKLIERF